MRSRWLIGVVAVGVGLAGAGLAGCTAKTPDPAAPPRTTAADSSPTAAAPPTTRAPALTGTLYYFPDDVGNEAPDDSAVFTWDVSGSKLDRKIAVEWIDGILSLNVSPDGKRVAWVGYENHTLYVANVDGTGKRTVRKQVDRECTEPYWSPDGKQLVIRPMRKQQPGNTPEPGDHGILDLGSGKFTAFPSSFEGCHAVWSADGTTIAATGGGIYLAKPDGSGSRALTKPDGTEWPANDLESISPDGKRIALWLPPPGEPAGDVARSLYANTIVDTTTGAQIKPDFGGQLVQALFTADGGILARVKVGSKHEIVLLSPAGDVIVRQPEPNDAKTMMLLAYVP